MNFLQAMTDPKLFGKAFGPRLLRGDTHQGWRACGAALFGLPVDESGRALIQQCTGRTDLPNPTLTSVALLEALLLVARRGGKSKFGAAVAVHLACLRDYSEVLAPGEVGTILILAADRRQARVIFGYVEALIDGAPALRNMITSRTKESIDLKNKVRIEIHTASFKSIRGYSVIACLADEICFWSDESGANPASEILKAVRPAMASIPGAVLLCLSSPYAKRGVAFETFKEHYGKNGAPVLVWKAPTRVMNPTISEATIAASRLRDPAAARSEWDAEFRDDLENFIPLEIVEARTITGCQELPPVAGTDYHFFVDMSGGSVDSAALACAHQCNGVAVLDVLREVRPPFSPESVAKEFANIVKRYGCSVVTGDAYAGEWPREQFRKYGIKYELSEKNRSELYLELLPLLMSAQCELLDNVKLKNQLVGLERRVGRTGKDSIDHPPGSNSHDDVANSAAGCLVSAHTRFLPWPVALAREHKAAAAAQSHPQPEGVDETTTKQAAEQLNQATKIGWGDRVFGKQVKPLPAGKVIKQHISKPTQSCPQCGNLAIGRSGVSGVTGDIEEKCGRCGWSQIVPATLTEVAIQ